MKTKLLTPFLVSGRVAGVMDSWIDKYLLPVILIESVVIATLFIVRMAVDLFR